jgi:hypothetical protein
MEKNWKRSLALGLLLLLVTATVSWMFLKVS